MDANQKAIVKKAKQLFATKNEVTLIHANGEHTYVNALCKVKLELNTWNNDRADPWYIVDVQ